MGKLILNLSDKYDDQTATEIQQEQQDRDWEDWARSKLSDDEIHDEGGE